MCVYDHLQSIMSSKSYINSVIVGMVVRIAVNQKKRENGMTAQLPGDPICKIALKLSGG